MKNGDIIFIGENAPILKNIARTCHWSRTRTFRNIGDFVRNSVQLSSPRLIICPVSCSTSSIITVNIIKSIFKTAKVYGYAESAPCVQKLKNNSDIDGFIHEGYSSHQLEEKISTTITNLEEMDFLVEKLNNPEDGTPLADLRRSTGAIHLNDSYSFLGLVIAYQSVIKYSEIRKECLMDKDVLIGIYISAISDHLGVNSKHKGTSWKLRIGSLYFTIITIDDINFIYVFESLSDFHYTFLAELLVRSADLIHHFIGRSIRETLFLDERAERIISQELDELTGLIDINLRAQYRIRIVYHNFSDIRAAILSSLIYQVGFSNFEFVIMEYNPDLPDDRIDVMLLNTTRENLQESLCLLSELKRKNPRMKILMEIEGRIEEELIELLNYPFIDMISFSHSQDYVIEDIIQKLMTDAAFNKIYAGKYFYYDQSSVQSESIVRSLFSEHSFLLARYKPRILLNVSIFVGYEEIQSFTIESSDPIFRTLLMHKENIVSSMINFQEEFPGEDQQYISLGLGPYTLYHFNGDSIRFFFILEGGHTTQELYENEILSNSMNYLINCFYEGEERLEQEFRNTCLNLAFKLSTQHMVQDDFSGQ